MGVTDDSVADDGITVILVLPPGTYALSSTLTLPANVAIVGASSGQKVGT